MIRRGHNCKWTKTSHSQVELSVSSLLAAMKVYKRAWYQVLSFVFGIGGSVITERPKRAGDWTAVRRSDRADVADPPL
jgi:hypothetical protein